MKIAICDDDDIFLDDEYETIKHICESLGLQVEITKYTDPEQLLCEAAKYSLFFLDIKIGDHDGITIATRINNLNLNCEIFMVTNYDKYMDKAMNNCVFRFWTKPLNEERIKYGIRSAVKRISSRENIVCVHAEGSLIRIPEKNIIIIYSELKKTYIITTKSKIMVSDTYKSVISQLLTEDFCESYANITVNFNYVLDFDRDNVYYDVNGKKERAYMSKRKYKNFRIKITEWMGNEK